MIWVLIVVLLVFWILKFGLGLGSWWIPVLMGASWLYFLLRLFARHEQN